TQQDVVQKSKTRDDDYRNPILARLDELPGINKAVRKQGPDDESQQGQQNRTSNLLLRQTSCKRAELWLERKKHRDHNCAGDGRKQVSLTNKHAEQKNYSQSNRGGCFQLPRG